MTICDKINEVGETLQENLNDRGVSCTFGTGTGESTVLEMVEMVNGTNFKGSSDVNLKIGANRPYLLTGETTDVVVKLEDGLCEPLKNKSVTVSDGTNTVNGVTDEKGEFALYNVSVTDDTTFTASYGTETATCLVEYCDFVDYCTSSNNKSSGYLVGRGTYSLSDDGLSIITTIVNNSNQYNFRIYNGQVTVPFEISFELVSNDTDNARMYFYNGNYGTELGNLSIYDLQNPTLVKFTVTSEKITRTIGTTSTDMTLSTTIGSTVSTRFGYNQSASAESTKIRNFHIKQL